MRRTAVLAAAGLLSMAIVGGCSSDVGNDATSDGEARKPGEALTAENIVGTWKLQDGKGPEGPVDPLKDHPIELTFAPDLAVSGSSGCNNIMGTATVTDGALDMGALGQTMMACEEDAMTVEFAYTQALDQVTGGDVDPGVALHLTGEGVELNYVAE